MKHIGLHASRLKKDQNNPREVAFAEQWQKENDEGQILSWLLSRNSEQKQSIKSKPSERDIEVAATVIQWLGSNVGMSFLEEAIRREPKLQEWARRRFVDLTKGVQ